jgi:hypothetical protein
MEEKMNCWLWNWSVILAVILVSGFSGVAEAIDLMERWDNAAAGSYAPDNSEKSLIKGDMGTWVLGATIDGSDELDCGPIPHTVEIQSAGGDKVLYLRSGTSTEGCSDNIWAVLYTNFGFPINNHIAIPISPNITISFEESGSLENPGQHGWGYNCILPPCYDNISVKIEDTNGNVLAYVLQRYPQAQPLQTRDYYYEIHLDPEVGIYSRNLYEDFLLMPTFRPGSNIFSIGISVDEHGWSLFDNLHITDTLSVVNGACGISNGGTFTSAPTTNLCTAGTPSAVSGTGPWSWICQGLNGGTDASCSAVPIGTPIFGDIPSDYWAYYYIEAIFNEGITAGCSLSPALFCPEEFVTREQMAVFLTRALGQVPEDGYCGSTGPFLDVAADRWSCKYIKKLVELGITTGIGQGLFGPMDGVTREQMAVFITRALSQVPADGYCGTTSPFTDVPYDYWSCKYVKRLVELGITVGIGQGLYGPVAQVTRAQMAVFLFRAFLSN